MLESFDTCKSTLLLLTFEILITLTVDLVFCLQFAIFERKILHFRNALSLRDPRSNSGYLLLLGDRKL